MCAPLRAPAPGGEPGGPRSPVSALSRPGLPLGAGPRPRHARTRYGFSLLSIVRAATGTRRDSRLSRAGTPTRGTRTRRAAPATGGGRRAYRGLSHTHDECRISNPACCDVRSIFETRLSLSLSLSLSCTFITRVAPHCVNTLMILHVANSKSLSLSFITRVAPHCVNTLK